MMGEIWKYFVYGIGFFLATLLIQWIINRKNKNTSRKVFFWTGCTCVIGICVLGIINHSVYQFASIIGFAVGDSLGEALGWH